jgi:hypothetical protein
MPADGTESQFSTSMVFEFDIFVSITGLLGRVIEKVFDSPPVK